MRYKMGEIAHPKALDEEEAEIFFALEEFAKDLVFL